MALAVAMLCLCTSLADAETRHIHLDAGSLKTNPYLIFAPGLNVTVVEIYPAATPTSVRGNSYCTIGVTGGSFTLKPTANDDTKCSEVISAFYSASTTLAITIPGIIPTAKPSESPGIIPTVKPTESPVWYVTFDVLEYQGNKSYGAGLKGEKFVLDKQLGTSSPDNACYIYINQWLPAECSPGVMKAEDNVRMAVQAALDRGDSLQLIVRAIDAAAPEGAYRRVPLVSRPEKKEGESNAALGSEDSIVARCKVAASKNGIADMYFACVDVYAKRQGYVLLWCTPAGKCDVNRGTLRTNRNIVVAVFADPDSVPKVTLSGTAGMSSGLYDSTSAKTVGVAGVTAGTGRAGDPATIWNFEPRKAGSANLVVSAMKGKEETARFEQTLTVIDEYSAMIRLGLAVTWKPRAEKLGIHSTQDGQRFTAIEESGLFATEVVTGVTWVWPSVRQDSTDIAVGVGARLGILSVGADTIPLSSIMAGVELCVGPDISLGLYGGFSRYDRVSSEYEEGSLVPTAVQSLPVNHTLTPSVSIVFNFTPGVSKTLGIGDKK